MNKYTITKTTNGYQINKWSVGAEKYVPCTIKATKELAEFHIKKALAVR